MKLSEMRKNEERTIRSINVSTSTDLIALYSFGLCKDTKIKYLHSAPFFGSRAFLVNGNIISIPAKKCAFIEVN